MTSDSRKILAAFVRQEPASIIGSFEDWLGENCSRVIGIDLSQIDVFVEANKLRLWNYVKVGMRELHDLFDITFVEIVDEDRMLFRNLQFDLATAPRSVRDLKLGYRWALLNFVDQLTWRQYESLASVAVRLFRARNAILTPSGTEGGVDLYAVVPNCGPTQIFHGRHAFFKIVGQSKMHANPLDVGRTREFIHVVDAVRHRSAEINSRIPLWFHEVDGPIIGWINAHSGFQSGSTDLAKIHGLAMSDTIRVCESMLSIRRTPAFNGPQELIEVFSNKIMQELAGAEV